jgi:hypothetical protein
VGTGVGVCVMGRAVGVCVVGRAVGVCVVGALLEADLSTHAGETKTHAALREHLRPLVDRLFTPLIGEQGSTTCLPASTLDERASSARRRLTKEEEAKFMVCGQKVRVVGRGADGNKPAREAGRGGCSTGDERESSRCTARRCGRT